MNKVTVPSQPQDLSPQKGDIFKDPKSGDVYIIARPHMNFLAINLNFGGTWSGEHKTAESAVHGLDFVGRHMTIEIS
jgi:hypothetical protein